MNTAPREDGDFPQPLRELAGLAGVATEYHDIRGELKRPSERSLRAILGAMGYGDIEQSIEELRQRPYNRFIEPVMLVAEDDQPRYIPAHLPCEPQDEENVEMSLTLTDEDDVVLEMRKTTGVFPVAECMIEGRRHISIEIHNDIHRPPGYYDLSISVKCGSRQQSARMKIIVTPGRCYLPRRRTWGITLSLYGLRSSGNWGVGDMGDLRRLVKAAGRQGAGFVGISPLHAVPNSSGEGFSPYQPISRLYRNHIYVDLSALSGINRKDYEDRITALREAELVDYEGVGELKLAALREAYETFRDTHLDTSTVSAKAQRFLRYCEREGRALKMFAIYMALHRHLRAQGRADSSGWLSWPPEYHDPFGPAVAAFRADNEDEVEFYLYIQWVLHNQLKDAGESAEGMDLGIYNDLAVGSAGGGSDSWTYGDVFARGMNMGAPPDDFSPHGQNWLFPPIVPERLRESGYEVFVRTLQKGIEHCGALRIDHALGLFRCFWIPQGMDSDEGTYVDYPYRDLLGIIALESWRNKVVIIGEDLGTVGDNVHRALYEHAMLSYRLFYFERDWDSGTFLPPEQYPEVALSGVTTHDLPTIRGFMEGRDIEARARIGLYAPGQAEAETSRREQEVRCLMVALEPFMEGADPKDPEAIIRAAYTFIACTPSLMASMSLDNALGLNVQQNLPGTTGGHPNWRRKYPLPIEEIVGPRRVLGVMADLFDIFRRTRGS